MDPTAKPGKYIDLDEAAVLVVGVWGRDARCWVRRDWDPQTGAKVRYEVGMGGAGNAHIKGGVGATWEEALIEAGLGWYVKLRDQVWESACKAGRDECAEGFSENVQSIMTQLKSGLTGLTDALKQSRRF